MQHFHGCILNLFPIFNPMKAISEIDSSLLPWLGKASKRADYYIADCFLAHGIELSKVQFILLKKLTEKDGQPQHNLAFHTNRDKASLARLLSTMEKKGMVKRKVCKKDRRINHVFITDYGKEILEQAVPVIHEIIETIQTEISAAELETTIRVLKKLGKNIQPGELTHSQN